MGMILVLLWVRLVPVVVLVMLILLFIYPVVWHADQLSERNGLGVLANQADVCIAQPQPNEAAVAYIKSNVGLPCYTDMDHWMVMYIHKSVKMQVDQNEKTIRLKSLYIVNFERQVMLPVSCESSDWYDRVELGPLPPGTYTLLQGNQRTRVVLPNTTSSCLEANRLTLPFR